MKRFFRISLVCAAMLLCGGCGRKTPVPWNYVDTAMGTVIHQGLYCAEEETAEDFSGRVMELLEKLEGETLSWRLETSQVYEINRGAGNVEGVLLTGELAALLRECMELSEASEGAFDVTIGALTSLWNLDRLAAGGEDEIKLPSKEAVEGALSLCGFEAVRLERGQAGDEKIYLPEGMAIDLGACGKGYALTKILTLLDAEPEITGAVVAVGGSVLTYGGKPDGTSWKVGIADPFDSADYIGTLSLNGQWCVSTSGDYERYVEVDGVRYHHILDPDTGYPASSGVKSVTVLSEDGLAGDGLSTACFILGPERGMELAASYGAEALFVMRDGEIVLSDGMAEYWTEGAR